MYKINDFVAYKNDICRIKNIKENRINNTTCYIMNPIDDESLTIEVPTDNRLGNIRDLLTKNEVNKLIDEIPNIKPIEDLNDKYIENSYKELINSRNHLNLIKVIKTTYLRKEERIRNKKKINEKDNKYFDLAEKYLYN